MLDQLSADGDAKWKILSFYSHLRERKWFNTFRSPIEFCSSTNFSRPAGRDDIMQRVRTNSHYFFTNYILLAVLLLSYSIISKPSLVICIGIFAWMWMYANNNEEIRLFGRIALKGRIKFGILTCLTAFVFIWLAGGTIVFTISLAMLIVALHTIFHSSVNPEDVEDFDLLPTDIASMELP